MDENKPRSKAWRRVGLAVAIATAIYILGLFALPPVIMLTSAASLARLFNTIYAPLISAMQGVPGIGAAWNAYMSFFCEATAYSCSTLVP